MLGKVKQFGVFLIKGAFSGIKGFLGFCLFIISVFLLIQCFCGSNNIFRYIYNASRINKQNQTLNSELIYINQLKHRINLINNHSSDYIEELSQKYLNVGNPNNKIIKNIN